MFYYWCYKACQHELTLINMLSIWLLVTCQTYVQIQESYTQDIYKHMLICYVTLVKKRLLYLNIWRKCRIQDYYSEATIYIVNIFLFTNFLVKNTTSLINCWAVILCVNIVCHMTISKKTNQHIHKLHILNYTVCVVTCMLRIYHTTTSHNIAN